MKTVYTIQPYEEGLRSDGFYEFESLKDAYKLISRFGKAANHPVKIVLREHEIEHDCEVCGSGSIVGEITLDLEHIKECVRGWKGEAE